jgi:sterol desaturase/sphingolipid hydroxylase (fatty acid hydroxylase superfamily)
VNALSLFVLGLFAWTLVEYVIHGWMSHTFATFAAPLHDVHHRDPHAIFTIGAWLPVAALWTLGIAIFGLHAGMIFVSGIVAGFVAYEAIHYRIHFSRPACAIEERLRARHLAHHQRMPDRCFGVTSPLWDLIFGTEPLSGRDRLWDSVTETPPLRGRTNVRLLLSFHYLRRRQRSDPAAQA